MKYVLSPQAGEDLESIYEYTITKWGVEQFQKYRQQIEYAIQAIVENPFLPRSKERNDLLNGIRLFRVEHHYIEPVPKNDIFQNSLPSHENVNNFS